jgi:23S rRNA (uracil1939-C5)-methyltransferase
MVSRGDEIELNIESGAFEGNSVARSKGLVYFVPFGVPGDKVLARVTRKKRKFAEATIFEIIEPSPNRIEPRCRYFGICGGCKLQNVEYDIQLDMKRRQVSDLFTRIGRIDEVEVAEVIPSPDEFNYRNKMEFSFGSSRWLTQDEIDSGRILQKGFALGLHIPKRYDKVLDLEECYLQSDSSVGIVNRFRKLALEEGWSAYNSRENSGYLRNLIIRSSRFNNGIAINLVTTRFEEERATMVLDVLTREFTDIVAIDNTVNSTRSPVASSENAIHLLGNGTYREKVGSREFIVGPTCFFQPNPGQAENLFQIIKEFSRLNCDDVLYDIFCGVGAIGLTLSPHVSKVIGIESHPESIYFAQKNIELNHAANCTFLEGDAMEALDDEFFRKHGVPSVMVLDPPRAGLHPKLVDRIIQKGAPRIVYTSCNPATQARDLNLLKSHYQIQVIQPVDMFPQTYHIETVVALERKL